MEHAVENASIGAWTRTWGPLFWTYVYQDLENYPKPHEVKTFVARSAVWTWGGAHTIWRCDGTGPTYGLNQGSTESVYNVWEEDEATMFCRSVQSPCAPSARGAVRQRIVPLAVAKLPRQLRPVGRHTR